MHPSCKGENKPVNRIELQELTKSEAHTITGGKNKMARTIRVKLFKFNELSEKAKETAINEVRNNGGIDTSHYYEDAEGTVKEFCEIFGVETGRRSWLDVSTDKIDDNICNLKGLRLRKYIVNNFWHNIYKGKYFLLWSKTEKSYKHYPEGYPVLKTRYSKVIFERSCPLTGVWSDNAILFPIYEFLDGKGNWMETTFEDLMKECFESLRKDLEDSDSYAYSDEAITEEIENNEYEFTKDGERF